jgi:hypothetical protein
MGPRPFTVFDQSEQLFAFRGRQFASFVEFRLCEFTQLDPFREIDLALHRQQIRLTDLLQIEPDRIADARGLIGLFEPLLMRSPAIFFRVSGGLLENLDSLGDERGIELIEMLDLILSVRKEREKIIGQQVTLRAALFEKIGHGNFLLP